MNKPQSTLTKSRRLWKFLLIILIIAGVGYASLYSLFYLILVKPMNQIGQNIKDYVQKIEVHDRGGDVSISFPELPSPKIKE